MAVVENISDPSLVAIAVILACLFAAGVVERRRHEARRRQIALRVSVNGSRGKSTVTRLVTGALAAAGYHALGKTTGTSPQLILGWKGTTEDIHRRPEGPNIGEQRDLVRRAAAEGATALVAECMAVLPEYQRVFHRELLDVTTLFVTNALDDHLEQMGPTSADVAEVFADTVPYDGVMVVTPGPHLQTFVRAAKQRRATLLVADPDAIEPARLREFRHLVWPEHVALVLAWTRHLGIDDEVAVAGMLGAPVDPFATRIVPIGDPSDPAWFVNAFAANDPASALGVWARVRELGLPERGLVVIVNCRADRVERTHQFASSVLPQLPIDTLVVLGRATHPIRDAVAKRRVRADTVHDLTGRDADDVLAVLPAELRGRVILTLGNLHGGGAEVVAALEARSLAPVRADT